MNSQTEDVIGVATELQREGIDPVQAAYIAHMVVLHKIDPFVARGLPDPRRQHLTADHTGAGHSHSEKQPDSPSQPDPATTDHASTRRT